MENKFENCETIEGLEHLGRAIVDANGVPSGSPANYENLCGSTGFKPVDVEQIKSKISDELSAQLPQ